MLNYLLIADFIKYGLIGVGALLVLISVCGMVVLLIKHRKGAPAEEQPKEAEPVEEQPQPEPQPEPVEEQPVEEEPEPQPEPVEEQPVEEEPEPVEEQPVEEEPEPEPQPEPEPEEAEEETERESESDENECELRMVEEDGVTRYIVIKYSKSFQAKLIQGDNDVKRYYSELKNYLLSYGVKSRMSWKWETYRQGRKTLVKLRLRGKTLSVCLALNADDYVDTKYIVENISDIAAYEDTPCLYRIKNDRRLRYVKELIDKVMTDEGLAADPNAETVDYVSQYPYETTEALLERKLIKELTNEKAQSGTKFKPAEIKKSVTVAEADSLLNDELAEQLVEKEGGVSDRTKTGIINIDTLSQNFNDGERVTLEEIKKRIAGFSKVTYLKVLARGSLDKRLTIEADNFSLQAVKMIILTGGKAIRK